MAEVPRARQCTLPDCTRGAVDPTRRGGLCKHHLDRIEGGDRAQETSKEPTHDNPIDRSDVTDAERAQMLREYLEQFVEEFGAVPRLMPLDEDGKAPIIQGRCRLDSPEGREYLIDGEEAIQRIREEGARGFALYAGKWDHKTEDLVLVDVDDRETFPYEAFPDTLTVLSGSGRGEHFTYRNSGAVQNAAGKDGVDGEVRAENWYCVTPGSIHPSGGVYHLVDDRPIAELATDDIPPELQPGSRRQATDQPTLATDRDGDGERPDDADIEARLEAAFTNSHDGDRIEAVYNGDYRAAGFDDRSSAEYWLANRLDSWVACGDRHLVADLMGQANLQKWPDRPDRSYRDSVLQDIGSQDWYYDPDDDGAAYGKPVAVLPDDEILQHAASNWDWRHAGRVHEDLTLDEAQTRTLNEITVAYENRRQVLIEALPTMGKTTGAIRAAAETEIPITYLCPRRDVMDEVADLAREHELDVYVLPAFTRHCDTANGEHGEAWQETVRDWYRRGATPQDIHKHAEYELGRPLPCQAQEGQECPYTSMWRFDPDEFDVLIGHYAHGYKQTVTTGRMVVFDEFPSETYEQPLGHHLEASVSAFLAATPGLPFEDFTDLLEHRTDAERRATALQWFEDHDLEEDASLVFETDSAHAQAPYAVFTILAGTAGDLGNGWERAALPEGGVGLFNREQNTVHLLTPPDLQYSRGIVGLDGTPTMRMWELTLGVQLTHRQVLSDTEREVYLADVLNHNIVPTTEYIKPYSNPDYVNLDEDRALLEGICAQHGQPPTLITTYTAEKQYGNNGVLSAVQDIEHYGNLKSSNAFASERLGVVIGSRHYGDGFIEKWGAYAGETVERDGKGVDLSYGTFGDQILAHMREHETLQAVLRFGRDGYGATVYVHTAALPDWVPTAGEGRVITTWSEGMHQVLEVANGLDSWRTAEIAAHPAIEIGERQVRTHLNTLTDRGYLERTVEGRGFVWRDDGLHRVNAHGEVELNPVTDGETVAEVARMTFYTWEFRNPAVESTDREPLRSEASWNGPSDDHDGANNGGRPPP